MEATIHNSSSQASEIDVGTKIKRNEKEGRLMTSVELNGWGTMLRIVTLTPKLVKELTETGVDDQRLDDILNERSKNEIGFSGIAPGYEILVDGEPIDPKLMKKIQITVYDPDVVEPGKAYLVREELLDGSWFKFEDKQKFKPSKLDISTETLVLPDGESFQIYRADYEGADDFGETSGTNLEEYVFLKNGKRVELKKVDY